MPRQSAAAAEFATGDIGTRHLLRPPEHLNDEERREFADLVVGAPARHFLASDLPLVAAYARAIVAERTAAAKLAADPVWGAVASPWLQIWTAKVRAMTTLGRMLSLNPAGRVPSLSLKPAEPVSYYERMSLLEGRRDEPSDAN